MRLSESPNSRSVASLSGRGAAAGHQALAQAAYERRPAQPAVTNGRATQPWKSLALVCRGSSVSVLGMPLLLQACLNGDRTREEHPAVPRSPDELAAEGRSAVEAGASVLHLHPYDEAGKPTLEAEACAAALRAVRSACPGVPICLSTSAAIEPDPGRRLELVRGWTDLPDLVTANQGERGISQLCGHFLDRGVGIEAGLLEGDDARAFVTSGIADRCVRVLIEPLDSDPEAALTHAAAMEATLAEAGIDLEQVHHGDGLATWSVMERAARRGHGIRVGLEDTVFLPDGTQPAGNAELVRAAVALRARLAP